VAADLAHVAFVHHDDLVRAPLRCACAFGRAEGSFSLLTRHLFLIPGYAGTRKRDRAISSRPAQAGLEHRGWEIVMFLDGVNEINKVRWSDASQARASLPMQAKTGLACGPRYAPRFCGERGAKNCPEATFFFLILGRTNGKLNYFHPSEEK
jgi:hypothetical protein